MANTPDPVDVVLRLRAALETQDLETASSLLRDDVVQHVPGNHTTNGDYTGLAGLLEFGAASRATGAHTEREVVDVLAGSDHVAVYCNITGHRPGRPVLHNPTLHLYRIEDGRVAEIWFHNRDQAAVDAFWS